ncbi:phospholipase D-like domain-containing protein [Ktedonobacter racemifer]|uniref:Helicase domain-containing protein n=1 Tax=Ktedonobacter racemifer DSM 44963 TaxID=485913 RepID=D6TX34_KTERA|nr:phospholipase D-like domain-containing protein [Ktedonobacter racemifer]EFH84767.1 helicase domain-containing protein [Ktedonobacter racemifer DSM 44963]
MNTIQPPDRTLPMLLDNQHAPLQDTLHHLLAHHAGQALDICITRLTPAGWALLCEDLQRIGNLRLLLNPAALVNSGDDPLEDLPSSFTAHQTGHKNAEESYEEQLAQTEALIAFLQQEHVEVRLAAEHTHLHARCFLFYADQDSALIAPQTAIVGSSDLTRTGLLSNAELNVVHHAHLTHEDIALKRLRGLLEREERTLLLQCTREQRLLAARLPTLLLLEHLTTWFAHHWEHAINGKHRLIAHLQTHGAQYSGVPMKQHNQPGGAPEEAQPPHRKNASAPLSGIPRDKTWAEQDYTQHRRD